MPKDQHGQVLKDKHWYPADEAARWLRTTAATIKAQCRKGALKGEQAGTRKQWHVQGAVIRKRRKELKLDLLDGDAEA